MLNNNANTKENKMLIPRSLMLTVEKADCILWPWLLSLCFFANLTIRSVLCLIKQATAVASRFFVIHRILKQISYILLIIVQVTTFCGRADSFRSQFSLGEQFDCIESLQNTRSTFRSLLEFIPFNSVYYTFRFSIN